MNKILNGDFSDEFNHWDNGVEEGDAFYINLERAQAASAFMDTDPVTYKMKQDFSINDEVVTAKLTIWGGWYSFSGIVDGYIRFKVELEKPDTSKVTILDVTKTAEIGEGNILDEEDIKAHFDQYGNYKLWLTCIAATCYASPGPPAVYPRSYGAYDNINVDVVVKKYKTVHEKMGGTERLNDVVAVKKAEIIGMVESYSTNVSPCQFSSASDIMGLHESYSTIKTLYRNVAESMGLVERLQARRTHGNLVTTYTIEDLLGWDAVSPRSTSWIKTKIIT